MTTEREQPVTPVEGRSGTARRLAIVTGASSGIGAQLALVLARRGWDLVLVARRAALLEQVGAKARAEGVAARELALDVTAPGSLATLLAASPGATLLVNNAGFGIVGRAIDVPEGDHERMIALNVTALTRLTTAFARGLVERGERGTILNVASLAAFAAVPYQAVYAATKAFVVSMSEGLDVELRARGVRVLAFCPGPTLTEANEVAGVGQDLAQGRRGAFLTAAEVAEHAARAIEGGRESAAPGWKHQLFRMAMQALPRRVVRRVMTAIYRRVGER